MLSYIFDFNLNVVGQQAERYLTKVVQQWPAAFEELPGVQGCLFLANAFTLSGRYSYSFRVDLDSFRGLTAFDSALKSDDKRWREIKAEWFERRTEVQGRLLRGSGQSYLDGGDGLIHVVLVEQRGGGDSGVKQFDEGVSARLSAELQSFDAVETAQHFSAVVQPRLTSGDEVWLRVANLEALDEFDAVSARANELVGGQLVSAGLYGELGLVEGALRSGA